MLATERILTILSNALIVALMSLAWHEITRPGKLLGFVASWLETVLVYLTERSTCACTRKVDIKPWVYILKAYAFITLSMRECFACLAGQLAIVYWLLLWGVPDNRSQWITLVALVCASILTTYPLNKLIHGRR